MASLNARSISLRLAFGALGEYEHFARCSGVAPTCRADWRCRAPATARTCALAPAVGLFDRSIDLALRLALGDRGALVVLALAFGQGDLDLEPPAPVVQPQRHECEPGLLGLARQSTNLARVHQQAPRPPRLVVPAVALVERCDVRIPQPDLA